MLGQAIPVGAFDEIRIGGLHHPLHDLRAGRATRLPEGGIARHVRIDPVPQAPGVKRVALGAQRTDQDPVQDALSQDRYGVLKNSDSFQMHWIPAVAVLMAQDVAEFYLAEFKEFFKVATFAAPFWGAASNSCNSHCITGSLLCSR